MVTAKGRRFAFVNYATVAEAEAVKAALSKMHTWRSNISFAKVSIISGFELESLRSLTVPLLNHCCSAKRYRWE